MPPCTLEYCYQVAVTLEVPSEIAMNHNVPGIWLCEVPGEVSRVGDPCLAAENSPRYLGFTPNCKGLKRNHFGFRSKHETEKNRTSTASAHVVSSLVLLTLALPQESFSYLCGGICGSQTTFDGLNSTLQHLLDG